MGGLPTFRGLPACSCLVAWCPAFEIAIGREVRWFQLAGDAKDSAGFHRGGGSADCTPLTEDELRIARNMGGAAWNRWWTDNYHAHIRLNGCPHNTIAQPQVADLNEGRDGTGPLWDNAGTPDNGPRDGIHWPLRTWREGIEWAAQQEDDMTPEEMLKAPIKQAGDRNLTVVLAQTWQNTKQIAAEQAAQRQLLTELAKGQGRLTDEDIARIERAISDAVFSVDVNINQTP